MNNQILIMEDDVYIAVEIAERIRLSGLGDVFVTHDEESCLSALQSGNFDLAILDITIQGRQEAGFEVARKIGDVPFIFLSGHNHKRFAAYGLGPHAFLRKPFDVNTMNSIELALLRGKSHDHPLLKKTPRITSDSLFIYHQGSHHKLALDSILFVRLEDGCLTVQAMDNTYVIWVTIEHFLEQVDSDNFLRIHRSQAINLVHLQRFSAEEVQVGDYTLSVSKTGLKLIHDAVRKLKSKRK